MTRAELVKQLLQKRRMTHLQAELVVEAIFDCVAHSLQRGERVEIRGFGTFEARTYAPYRGRNPKTGKAVDVQSRQLALFRASPMLAERLNQGQQPSAWLVHNGPGKPRKSTSITGVWQAIEDEAPEADEITRRMG
jgi:integration host factor subunit beta